MSKCEEAAEILKNLRGHAVTSTELIRAIASEGKGMPFVDWFTADIPGVLRALHMIVLQTSPEAASPILRRLTPGLGPEPPDGSKNT